MNPRGDNTTGLAILRRARLGQPRAGPGVISQHGIKGFAPEDGTLLVSGSMQNSNWGNNYCKIRQISIRFQD